MEIDKNALYAIWEKLREAAGSHTVEIITVRLDGRQGKWFSVSCNENTITIRNSRIHNPSVELSQERYVDKDEFIRIGQYYEGWQSGSVARPSIRNRSKNSSYIFGIIARFK